VTSGKTFTGYWKAALGSLSGWTDADKQYFDGKLDDIRIYNRILNDDEIEILYEECRLDTELVL
jgi:hypothetical protein